MQINKTNNAAILLCSGILFTLIGLCNLKWHEILAIVIMCLPIIKLSLLDWQLKEISQYHARTLQRLRLWTISLCLFIAAFLPIWSIPLILMVIMLYDEDFIDMINGDYPLEFEGISLEKAFIILIYAEAVYWIWRFSLWLF